MPSPERAPGHGYCYKVPTTTALMSKSSNNNNSSNQQNPNKGSSGTNTQYDKGQGNRGGQMNPNRGGGKGK